MSQSAMQSFNIGGRTGLEVLDVIEGGTGGVKLGQVWERCGPKLLTWERRIEPHAWEPCQWEKISARDFLRCMKWSCKHCLREADKREVVNARRRARRKEKALERRTS